MIKSIFVSLFIVFLVANNSLDELLQAVKSSAISNQTIDDDRLKLFLKDKKSKLKMLKEAKIEFKKEQKITQNLRATIDKNEKELTILEQRLKLRVGELGEMFGVVRQMGGDFKSFLIDSCTSAYIKNRDEELSNMLETKELPDIKKFENILKLIATVSPLLGLLGTVTGMIETFGAITLFGTGDPKLMAGGISQALMTTVLGLVVAIPMLFLYTFVSSASSKIVAILDEQSAGLIVKKMDY